MEINDEVYAEMTKMNMNIERLAVALYAITDELNRIRHCMCNEEGVYDDVLEATAEIYGMRIEDLDLS